MNMAININKILGNKKSKKLVSFTKTFGKNSFYNMFNNIKPKQNNFNFSFPKNDLFSKNKFKPFRYNQDAEELTAAKRFGGKNLQNLKPIGQGRDRKVYALDEDKVLKIAKNPGGLTQNTMESNLDYPTGQIKHYESGKDYVVMERADKPGKATKEMLQHLKKAKDESYNRNEHQQRADFFNSPHFEASGLDASDFSSYSVTPQEFVAKRQWGEKDGQPVLIDGGALSSGDDLSRHRVKDFKPENWQYKEWQDIQAQRQQNKNKGRIKVNYPEYQERSDVLADLFSENKYVPTPGIMERFSENPTRKVLGTNKGECDEAASCIVTDALKQGVPFNQIQVLGVRAPNPNKGEKPHSSHVVTKVEGLVYDPTKTQFGYDNHGPLISDKLDDKYHSPKVLPTEPYIKSSLGYVKEDEDSKNKKLTLYHSTNIPFKSIKKNGFIIDEDTEHRSGIGIYSSEKPQDNFGNNIIKFDVDGKIYNASSEESLDNFKEEVFKKYPKHSDYGKAKTQFLKDEGYSGINYGGTILVTDKSKIKNIRKNNNQSEIKQDDTSENKVNKITKDRIDKLNVSYSRSNMRGPTKNKTFVAHKNLGNKRGILDNTIKRYPNLLPEMEKFKGGINIYDTTPIETGAYNPEENDITLTGNWQNLKPKERAEILFHELKHAKDAKDIDGENGYIPEIEESEYVRQYDEETKNKGYKYNKFEKNARVESAKKIGEVDYYNIQKLPVYNSYVSQRQSQLENVKLPEDRYKNTEKQIQDYNIKKGMRLFNGRSIEIKNDTSSENKIKQQREVAKYDDNIFINKFKTDGGYLDITEYKDNTGAVSSLYVDEEHRRKGIATKLLNEAKNKYNIIHAQVSNIPSVKTHYRAGFRLDNNPNATEEESIEHFKIKETGPGSIGMKYINPNSQKESDIKEDNTSGNKINKSTKNRIDKLNVIYSRPNMRGPTRNKTFVEHKNLGNKRGILDNTIKRYPNLLPEMEKFKGEIGIYDTTPIETGAYNPEENDITLTGNWQNLKPKERAEILFHELKHAKDSKDIDGENGYIPEIEESEYVRQYDEETKNKGYKYNKFEKNARIESAKKIGEVDYYNIQKLPIYGSYVAQRQSQLENVKLPEDRYKNAEKQMQDYNIKKGMALFDNRQSGIKQDTSSENKTQRINIPLDKAWNMRKEWAGPVGMKQKRTDTSMNAIGNAIDNKTIDPIYVNYKDYKNGLLTDGKHRLIKYKEKGYNNVAIEVHNIPDEIDIKQDEESKNKLMFWKNNKSQPENYETSQEYPEVTNQEFARQQQYDQSVRNLPNYGEVQNISGNKVGNAIIAADVIIPSGKLLTLGGLGVKKYVDKVKLIKTDEHDNKYRIPRMEVHNK